MLSLHSIKFSVALRKCLKCNLIQITKEGVLGTLQHSQPNLERSKVEVVGTDKRSILDHLSVTHRIGGSGEATGSCDWLIEVHDTQTYFKLPH